MIRRDRRAREAACRVKNRGRRHADTGYAEFNSHINSAQGFRVIDNEVGSLGSSIVIVHRCTVTGVDNFPDKFQCSLHMPDGFLRNRLSFRGPDDFHQIEGSRIKADAFFFYGFPEAAAGGNNTMVPAAVQFFCQCQEWLDITSGASCQETYLHKVPSMIVLQCIQ